ncbi:MAG: hypothetical protein KGL16_12440, partial [Acidobacteriota bacterium]|nr:hypothetical protein [Acidobacteriota bacterium]
MCVALTALFLSAGGASYAAVTIPAHSVGATQLKSFAVTNPKLGVGSVGSRKIMPGAVGFYRVNRSEVQLRVTGACTGASSAITSVNISGGVTCGNTSPAESNSASAAAKALSASPATVASLALAGGSQYLVQADPYITVSDNTDPGAQTVDVSCTLAAGTSTSATETRDVTLNLRTGQASASASIPLTVVQPASANSTTATLSCTDKTTGGIADATLKAEGTIYALT